ncbi:hypothetical protein TWF696_000418 [Orbilia brochopaga]|uniref:Uncharacterized protein n=1 Tax=Orbilia brochopaga TaxID=3140254 RepID=A0AAV9VBB2_9PEZI
MLQSILQRLQGRRPNPTPSTPEPAPANESPNVVRIDFNPASINKQSDSPLFQLPGELRNQIWAYALTPYLDTTRPYPEHSCYARPDYNAPRVTAVALLRTCKAIYQEAWYLPWLTAELGFYLTWAERRPDRVETVPDVQRILNHLAANDVDTTISHVRVFAQLCNLEDGFCLQDILNMKHFRPLEVTVTIRHTDFWSWENDASLTVGSNWVRRCAFPNSTQVVRVEFESLERKKASIDHIARQAVEHWEFKRRDGTKLTAKRGNMRTTPAKEGEESVVYDEGETEVMRWTGSSTWAGERWIRDEIASQPGKLQYYVKSVVWRVKAAESAAKDPEPAIDIADTAEPEAASQGDQDHDSDEESEELDEDFDSCWDEDYLPLIAPPETDGLRPAVVSVETTTLEELGCDDSMNADEVAMRVIQWQSEYPPPTSRALQSSFFTPAYHG